MSGAQSSESEAVDVLERRESIAQTRSEIEVRRKRGRHWCEKSRQTRRSTSHAVERRGRGHGREQGGVELHSQCCERFGWVA